jgi:predicted GNAT family acetyltransferase
VSADRASSGKTTGGTVESPVVTDVPAKHRYEARVGGDLAGLTAYLRAPQIVAFVHTEVEDAYEGRGIGSAMARAALDEARAQHLRVVAICPFIAGWIERHPEYQDLVYEPDSRVTD